MSNIDKQALRKAAEKATPGRIGDRIDGSGSIKYQCFGNDGSLVLQTDHKNMEYGFIGVNSEADELFFRLCDPATVLALLDKLEAAEKRIVELEASHNNLREAMAGIHNTIAGGGAYTPLAAILNASKRAYEESDAAAGKGEAS
ncbi:ead/Ea22-like family protein [Enterobacter ludwigii]|uniref:ead/Ea22-like family protein n=1 Tax=Enterobacter ludwigii TaxID=299767 RepID=UPI00288C0B5C|nr:ead/Ea22-like family protein [Enterobacter ludwigii]WNI43787.1 ead/Ea22-like family protein [Enterobacter ludwigii]WNI55511.1 ead/Ea22-like family protein [Enterobacter ludwigii]WNI80582.1 ead/Ea22-like family protein [Enterobacter ludwigii]